MTNDTNKQDDETTIDHEVRIRLLEKIAEKIDQSNERLNIFIEKYSEEEFKKQLDIELLKQKNGHMEKTLDKIEANQKWMLGLMGAGFLGILGLIAHGFKWIS